MYARMYVCMYMCTKKKKEGSIIIKKKKKKKKKKKRNQFHYNFLCTKLNYSFS